MKAMTTALSSVLLLASPSAPGDLPTVAETTALGPLTGEGASLHPDNISPHLIEYYGTDLGWTYEHQGQIHFLFGDTMADEAAATPIEPASGPEYDDSFGTIDLSQWPDPGRISPDNIPLIKIGQNPGTSDTSAINPGHALGLFKTPLGGFSNGEREFGIFFSSKPLGCNSDSDCVNHLTCDTGLGYSGEKYTNEDGLTLGCIEGSSSFCVADTMFDADDQPIRNSGLCRDKTSTIWGESGTGRTNSIAVKQIIGVRDTNDPRRYSQIHEWYTNKFFNLALRTVESFVPSQGPGQTSHNYLPARGSGGNQRVLLWGRPGFVGVGKHGRTLGLYFAYVDLPTDENHSWDVKYFTGTDMHGVPQFSSSELDAMPADLDSSRDGIQAKAEFDLVNQNTFAWVEPLKKWVMFFSGGVSTLSIPPTLMNCGLVELFAGPDCKDVDIGNGAVRMRTADNPWGPWSPAQDVIVGGDPSVPGSGQYGVGGMLRHPACTQAGCAPHTDTEIYRKDQEYGFFYAPSIIEQWIKPAGDGVDLYWIASTWDPYRVILLRTRVNP